MARQSRATVCGYFFLQLTLLWILLKLGKPPGAAALITFPLVAQAASLSCPFFAVLFGSLSALIPWGFIIGLVGFSPSLSFIPSFLGGCLFTAVTAHAIKCAHRARAQAEALSTDLTRANEQLRGYAAEAEDMATARERNRLAREIHDGLGHYLTTISLQLQVAKSVLSSQPELAASSVEKAQNLSQNALADVRRSVQMLRADEADPSLEEKCRALVADCRAEHVAIEFSTTGALLLFDEIRQHAIYRAVQEGLTNALKHSNATRIAIRLDFSEAQRARVCVSDNGTADLPTTSGSGLRGLRERFEALGGALEARFTRGSGFALRAELPR